MDKGQDTSRFTRITFSEPTNPSRAKMIVTVLGSAESQNWSIDGYQAQLPTHDPAVRVTVSLLHCYSS